MFIILTESRKDKSGGPRFTSRVCINVAHIKYVQERVSPAEIDTYIQLSDDKYIFIKETYKEVITMLTNLNKLL